ncbi:hypothetical protein TSUD_167960 [Trifolium subterraneum]|nr:hypothetical protein TSUD_167960 [Trifolium subterraneum]
MEGREIAWFTEPVFVQGARAQMHCNWWRGVDWCKTGFLQDCGVMLLVQQSEN